MSGWSCYSFSPPRALLDALLSISCISFCLSFAWCSEATIIFILGVFFFDRTFLSHHRTLDVLCPATCGHQLCLTCGHQLCPIRKINLIKINYLLFISILFYENQQTTLKFKVAPPFGRAFWGSGFAIGDRFSGLTLTIKMPIEPVSGDGSHREPSPWLTVFRGFGAQPWTSHVALAECILAMLYLASERKQNLQVLMICASSLTRSLRSGREAAAGTTESVVLAWYRQWRACEFIYHWRRTVG